MNQGAARVTLCNGHAVNLDLYNLMEAVSKKPAQQALRAGCLNFTELSAISIVNIGPTVIAALVIPLMYANAGMRSRERRLCC